MSENSPGRAAYEAFQRAFPDEDWGPWDMLDGDGHEGWEAVAQAAIAVGAPLCPNGCGCRLGTDDAETRDCACDGFCCYDEIEISAELDRLRRERDQLRAQLAAAVNPTAEDYDHAAEIVRLRELVREILAEIELGTLGQHTPQATARTLARAAEWRKRAGLLREPLPAEPQSSPDPAGHAVYHAPLCRCGHKQTVHAGVDATGRCALRSCGCGRFEAAPVRNPKRAGIEG